MSCGKDLPKDRVYKTIDEFVENYGAVKDYDERFMIEQAAFAYLSAISGNSTQFLDYKERYMNKVVGKYGSRC